MSGSILENLLTAGEDAVEGPAISPPLQGTNSIQCTEIASITCKQD